MGSRARGNEIHVLVLPFHLQGHINPMLQFTKRLASKGLKLTLVIPKSIGNSIQSQATSINVEFIFDGVKEGERAPIPDEYLKLYKAAVTQSIAELIERHSSTPHPIKYLIYDSMVPWLLDVARSSGIDGCPFFTQSCAVGAVYCHAIQGTLNFPFEEPVVSLPSIPPLEFNDLPSLVHDSSTYPGVYDMVFSQFSNINKPGVLLWNTFTELEDEQLKWMANKWPIMAIGPTIPSMFLDRRLEDDVNYGLSLFKPNSDVCMDWLASKEPKSVVYVSFGSLAALEEAQMTELAWGLKRSGRCFLWVVRESELNKLPWLIHFVHQTSDQGLLVTWTCQLEVLSHESVGCFVTHCGWNSLLEALSLGVPMIAMPQWTDQPTNAKFVSDVWRVGVRAKVDEKGLVPREETERCIREIMEAEGGNEMRRNSEKWKEIAKRAVEEGGSSDKNIEKFVAKLVQMCSSNSK